MTTDDILNDTILRTTQNPKKAKNISELFIVTIQLTASLEINQWVGFSSPPCQL
jgi:hypothetical protein